MTRLLYVIPIVHTEADLGSLAARTKQHSGATPESWDRKQATIAKFWAAIAQWCARELPADLSRFRLYQDGLPVCGRERAIVEDLALRGSANHRLLLDLLARNAALEGTESAPLLIEEYKLAQAMLSSPAPAGAATSPPSKAELAQRAASILAQRDAFIARRIDDTLKQGERGVLFIGLLHDVLTKLPRTLDIHTVRPPIER